MHGPTHACVRTPSCKVLTHTLYVYTQRKVRAHTPCAGCCMYTHTQRKVRAHTPYANTPLTSIHWPSSLALQSTKQSYRSGQDSPGGHRCDAPSISPHHTLR